MGGINRVGNQNTHSLHTFSFNKQGEDPVSKVGTSVTKQLRSLDSYSLKGRDVASLDAASHRLGLTIKL